MTVIVTDRMLEGLEFIGRNPWHPERMVYGPFDIERIDLSDEDIGLLEDIFGHGPMFAYYTLEYGTVPQLALAIKYLRYGEDSLRGQVAGETLLRLVSGRQGGHIEAAARPRGDVRLQDPQGHHQCVHGFRWRGGAA